MKDLQSQQRFHRVEIQSHYPVAFENIFSFKLIDSMNQNPELQPDQELNANAFHEYVNANPDAAYKQWQQAQQQAQQTHSTANVTPSSLNQSLPTYITLDPQALTTMIAQIVA